MKVVLDTNVILAAFAARGLCEAVFQACLTEHEIILSEYILREVRKNLVAKIKTPSQQADEILHFLRENTTSAKPAKLPADSCSDRTDLPVLGTALAGQAQCLVTGDKALLELKRFQNTDILSPRDFYDRIC